MITLEHLAERVAAIEPPRRFDPFSRKLARDELFLLHEKWRPLLGLEECEKSHIRYLHHRLVNIESLCSGRLAGDIREAVLRMLVATAVTSPEGFRMLEIGTLFGVNAAATWDIATTMHGAANLTVIDPLSGYYGAHRDPPTGLPVTRQTVELNLRRIGVAPGDVDLIGALSQNPKAIALTRHKRFNYMFIDGDHSGEGVLRDWRDYGSLLELGGYAIFDNYNDPSWPEVTDAVDRIASDKRLEKVGVEWRTIVFRRVA